MGKEPTPSPLQIMMRPAFRFSFKSRRGVGSPPASSVVFSAPYSRAISGRAASSHQFMKTASYVHISYKKLSNTQWFLLKRTPNENEQFLRRNEKPTMLLQVLSSQLNGPFFTQLFGPIFSKTLQPVEKVLSKLISKARRIAS